MRLKRIKLAGFKTFVDPTQLDLESQLVAILGPNGCGKSNVIDAIRWVMGESSAKGLRGESMVDVIFSGSSHRKAVGQASVELVFDNSDDRWGGEYAQYAEISIRRVVTRDGESQYFLNGSRCRKKDAMDLFLGTGLGTHSYAIIEQGMISRIVEADPEDLRAFLEEAAGISVYKKRRHEAELRMHHSRDNLQRLQDIREEQAKSLAKLAQQSEVALRFRDLESDIGQLDAWLTWTKRSRFQDSVRQVEATIGAVQDQLESAYAEKKRLQSECVGQKQQVELSKQRSDLLQESSHEVGMAIVKLQQNIAHERRRYEEQQALLLQCEKELQNVRLEQEQDEREARHLETQLLEWSPAHEDCMQQESLNEGRFAEFREREKAWAEYFRSHQETWYGLQREADLSRVKIEQSERQLQEWQEELARLEEEERRLDWPQLKQQATALQVVVEQSEKRLAQLESDRSVLQTHLSALESANAVVQADLKEMELQWERLQAEKTSLQRFERTDCAWDLRLAEQGMGAFPTLLQLIKPALGFEVAVEAALMHCLDAHCLDRLSLHEGTLKSPDWPGFYLESNALVGQPETPWDVTRLQSMKLQKGTDCPRLVDVLLEGQHYVAHLPIRVAPDFETAWLLRATLSPHESVVCLDGTCMGAHWLHRPLLEGGPEQRRLEHRLSLEKLLEEESTQRDRLVRQQRQVESSLKEMETQKTLLHLKAAEKAAQQSELERQRLKAQAAAAYGESAEQRFSHLRAQRRTLFEKMGVAQETLSHLRAQLEETIDRMGAEGARRPVFEVEREQWTAQHQEWADAVAALRDRKHRLALQMKQASAEQAAVEKNRARLNQLEHQLIEKLARLKGPLSAEQPTFQVEEGELALLFEQERVLQREREDAKTALQVARDILGTLEFQDETASKGIEILRGQLEKLQLNAQTDRVKLQLLEEQCADSPYKEAVLTEYIWSASLEGRTEPAAEKRLQQLRAEAARLGPINMAAVEEYRGEAERKQYLDGQWQDLTDALETLKEAIAKMDAETRDRLQRVFESVNRGFQRLFPQLFGGGEAYLDLEGADFLTAGVRVMARPPGKRNTSIQLLSGGEKALTAVALVFSIFQLNPAPFCLLDEVDAPLDDANVGRFCDLVKQLSNSVQFVYVTHNKLAMEMAQHLIGVTMKEPGVSRLVTVDVDAAMTLVAAADAG